MAYKASNVRELLGERYMNCGHGSLYNLYKKDPEFKRRMKAALNTEKPVLDDEGNIDIEYQKQLEARNQEAKRKATKGMKSLDSKGETLKITIPRKPENVSEKSWLDTLTQEERIAIASKVIEVYLWNGQSIKDACKECRISIEAFTSWRMLSSASYIPAVHDLWRYQVSMHIATVEFDQKVKARRVIDKALEQQIVTETTKVGTVGEGGAIIPTQIREKKRVVLPSVAAALKILESTDEGWNKYRRQGEVIPAESQGHNLRYLEEDEVINELESISDEEKMLEAAHKNEYDGLEST